MDAVAYRYFCYFMDNMVAGDLFTALEVMDYIKSRVKNHAPSKKDIGHMVTRYGQIKSVGYDRSTIYQVI